MATLAIKSGTTAIAGATVKGSFSYFSASTKDLGPTSLTGLYTGIDAPTGGFTVYQIGGPNGWTARVAADTSSLNTILISFGATGSSLDQRITWATNTDSVFINSGVTPTYTVGQSALGGIIAYTTNGGTSGFVITSSDVSTGAPWGCLGTIISGAEGTAIGTGPSNTAAIIAACPTSGIAARLCVNLTTGGYSDWYLPSQDELNAIYTNRTAIGGINSGFYWSSSQAVGDDFYSWTQYFPGGNQTLNRKDTSQRVRAIRSF
jgi:hypothetical protein